MIDDNLEYVKDYIKEHLNIIAKNNGNVDIPLNCDNIKKDDYYRFYDGNIHYYDTDEDVFYTIVFNEEVD